MLPIPVLDVFAGPGGLGEGFSTLRVEGRPVFRVALSIEKDRHAHATLKLRSFFRQLALDSDRGFADARVPEAYYQRLRGELTGGELYARFPAEAEKAAREAWCAELGSSDLSPRLVRHRIQEAIGQSAGWVLIGGPPCQAYSIAGRSRNRGVREYRCGDGVSRWSLSIGCPQCGASRV